MVTFWRKHYCWRKHREAINNPKLQSLSCTWYTTLKLLSTASLHSNYTMEPESTSNLTRVPPKYKLIDCNPKWDNWIYLFSFKVSLHNLLSSRTPAETAGYSAYLWPLLWFGLKIEICILLNISKRKCNFVSIALSAHCKKWVCAT